MTLKLHDLSIPFQLALARETKSPDILDAMTNSKNNQVLCEVLNNKYTSKNTKEYLESYLYYWDFSLSASQSNPVLSLSSELYSDDLMLLLANETKSVDILKFLASTHKSFLVRLCAIKNPNLPTEYGHKYLSDLKNLLKIQGFSELKIKQMARSLPESPFKII